MIKNSMQKRKEKQAKLNKKLTQEHIIKKEALVMLMQLQQLFEQLRKELLVVNQNLIIKWLIQLSKGMEKMEQIPLKFAKKSVLKEN
jgi:hypothetical protein